MITMQSDQVLRMIIKLKLSTWFQFHPHILGSMINVEGYLKFSTGQNYKQLQSKQPLLRRKQEQEMGVTQ